MTLHRRSEDSDPIWPERIGRLELRRDTRSTVLGTGTLACPGCDAPVAPAGTMSPGEWLACPFCDETGPVHEFLSLAEPTRPARVEVRVVARRLVYP